MARKKKTVPVNPVLIKFVLIGIFSLGMFFLVCFGVYKFASQSKLFSIKRILVDDSVSFINNTIFRKIEGQNIFLVDLTKMQERLSSRYPQISDLKVVRLFPDQLLITARKRIPFLQTMIDETLITIDDEGIVLSMKSKREKVIPFVTGIDARNIRVALGKPIQTIEMRTVLSILKSFQENDSLAAYDVDKVNIESLSRIHLFLSNDLWIIVDKDRIGQKLKDLGLFLSSKKLDIQQTKYIDLRYKDIVVKEK